MRFYMCLLMSVLLLCSTVVTAQQQDDYLVGSGDVIEISVYDNPDLATVVRIDTDGGIQFPLIGRVDLAGLTVPQVAKKLETLLADGYLVSPQVAVFIKEYRSKKVVIMGEVDAPGVYELRGPTTLLELISKAGGVKEDAGDKLTINRAATGEEEAQVKQIDLQRLLKLADQAQNVAILDGDNIFVAKAGMFYVTGEVARPDAYKLEEGTTVLKAVSMAGGFTKIAAKGRIRIIRTVDGNEQYIEDVSLQEPVKEDDVIVIPESFF